MAKPLYTTNVQPRTSKMRRIQWLKEDLIRASASKSFFNQFMATDKGMDRKGILVKSVNRKAGELVRFEEEGYLTEAMVKRPNVLRGTGESLRQFGYDITLQRFGKEVLLGDEWDAEALGRTRKETDSKARSQLTDYLTRVTDQAFYDTAQIGTLAGAAGGLAHCIALNTIGSDDFGDIRQILRTGVGYNYGNTSRRMPLSGFNSHNGEAKLNLIVDSWVVNKHFKDVPTKQLYLNGDTRGGENRLFTSEVRDFGDIRVVEAPSFAGSSNGNLFDADGYYQFENLTQLQTAGMRVYNPTAPNSFAVQAWQDEPGFSFNSANGLVSVGFILGKDAILKGTGFGDFRWDNVESDDYGITSNVALQLSMSVKHRILEPFNEDYDIKEAGIYNIIPLLIRVK